MTGSHPTVVPLRQPAALASVQGTLALDLLPAESPPPLRRPSSEKKTDLRRRRELERWVQRFGQASAEIVGGDRPASQLLRWTTREVYEDLSRRALLVATAGRQIPGQRRIQSIRPKILSVRVCFVTPSIAETSLHLRYGERSRALAARFEWREERWICTALAFA